VLDSQSQPSQGAGGVFPVSAAAVAPAFALPPRVGMVLSSEALRLVSPDKSSETSSPDSNGEQLIRALQRHTVATGSRRAASAPVSIGVSERPSDASSASGRAVERSDRPAAPAASLLPPPAPAPGAVAATAPAARFRAELARPHDPPPPYDEGVGRPPAYDEMPAPPWAAQRGRVQGVRRSISNPVRGTMFPPIPADDPMNLHSLPGFPQGTLLRGRDHIVAPARPRHAAEEFPRVTSELTPLSSREPAQQRRRFLDQDILEPATASLAQGVAAAGGAGSRNQASGSGAVASAAGDVAPLSRPARTAAHAVGAAEGGGFVPASVVHRAPVFGATSREPLIRPRSRTPPATDDARQQGGAPAGFPAPAAAPPPIDRPHVRQSDFSLAGHQRPYVPPLNLDHVRLATGLESSDVSVVDSVSAELSGTVGSILDQSSFSDHYAPVPGDHPHAGRLPYGLPAGGAGGSPPSPIFLPPRSQTVGVPLAPPAPYLPVNLGIDADGRRRRSLGEEEEDDRLLRSPSPPPAEEAAPRSALLRRDELAESSGADGEEAAAAAADQHRRHRVSFAAEADVMSQALQPDASTTLRRSRSPSLRQALQDAAAGRPSTSLITPSRRTSLATEFFTANAPEEGSLQPSSQSLLMPARGTASSAGAAGPVQSDARPMVQPPPSSWQGLMSDAAGTSGGVAMAQAATHAAILQTDGRMPGLATAHLTSQHPEPAIVSGQSSEGMMSAAVMRAAGAAEPPAMLQTEGRMPPRLEHFVTGDLMGAEHVSGTEGRMAEGPVFADGPMRNQPPGLQVAPSSVGAGELGMGAPPVLQTDGRLPPRTDWAANAFAMPVRGNAGLASAPVGAMGGVVASGVPPPPPAAAFGDRLLHGHGPLLAGGGAPGMPPVFAGQYQNPGVMASGIPPPARAGAMAGVMQPAFGDHFPNPGLMASGMPPSAAAAGMMAPAFSGGQMAMGFGGPMPPPGPMAMGAGGPMGRAFDGPMPPSGAAGGWVGPHGHAAAPGAFGEPALLSRFPRINVVQSEGRLPPRSTPLPPANYAAVSGVMPPQTMPDPSSLASGLGLGGVPPPPVHLDTAPASLPSASDAFRIPSPSADLGTGLAQGAGAIGGDVDVSSNLPSPGALGAGHEGDIVPGIDQFGYVPGPPSPALSLPHSPPPAGDTTPPRLFQSPEQQVVMVTQAQQTTPPSAIVVRPRPKRAAAKVKPLPKQDAFRLVCVDPDKYGTSEHIPGRPRRWRCGPLDFWKGEQVVRAKLPNTSMTTVIAVQLARPITPQKLTKARRPRGKQQTSTEKCLVLSPTPASPVKTSSTGSRKRIRSKAPPDFFAPHCADMGTSPLADGDAFAPGTPPRAAPEASPQELQRRLLFPRLSAGGRPMATPVRRASLSRLADPGEAEEEAYYAEAGGDGQAFPTKKPTGPAAKKGGEAHPRQDNNRKRSRENKENSGHNVADSAAEQRQQKRGRKVQPPPEEDRGVEVAGGGEEEIEEVVRTTHAVVSPGLELVPLEDGFVTAQHAVGSRHAVQLRTTENGDRWLCVDVIIPPLSFSIDDTVQDGKSVMIIVMKAPKGGCRIVKGAGAPMRLDKGDNVLVRPCEQYHFGNKSRKERVMLKMVIISHPPLFVPVQDIAGELQDGWVEQL